MAIQDTATPSKSTKQEKEDDRAKFVRLATARVNAALNAIRLVGNLSNRNNYDYTEKDVTKIVKTLQTALDDCKAKFGPAKDQKNGFKLD